MHNASPCRTKGADCRQRVAKKMETALLVGAGGFCGSLMRHVLSRMNRRDWLYGTLCANLIGAFAIGLLSTKLRDERVRR